jgi:hypothetical protein
LRDHSADPLVGQIGAKSALDDEGKAVHRGKPERQMIGTEEMID